MKKIMALFVFALLFVLPSAGYSGEKCLAVAYHDPTQLAPNDIIVEKTTQRWNGISKLRDTLKVISIHVLFENPADRISPNHVKDVYSGSEQYAIATIASSTRHGNKEGVQISTYTSASTPGVQEQGRRSTYFEGLGENDVVTGKFGEEPPSNDKARFFRGGQVKMDGISFSLSDEVYNDLQQRAMDHPSTQPGTCSS